MGGIDILSHAIQCFAGQGFYCPDLKPHLVSTRFAKDGHLLDIRTLWSGTSVSGSRPLGFGEPEGEDIRRSEIHCGQLTVANVMRGCNGTCDDNLAAIGPRSKASQASSRGGMVYHAQHGWLPCPLRYALRTTISHPTMQAVDEAIRLFSLFRCRSRSWTCISATSQEYSSL